MVHGSGPICPDCGSSDTRTSRKQGLMVKFLKRLKFVRYKCQTCGRRFYVAI